MKLYLWLYRSSVLSWSRRQQRSSQRVCNISTCSFTTKCTLGRHGRNCMIVGFTTTLYLCNQCLSPLRVWVWTPLRRGVLDTTLCDKVCQWLAADLWFSPVPSINKTDRHNITEILLKVALDTVLVLFNKIWHVTTDVVWQNMSYNYWHFMTENLLYLLEVSYRSKKSVYNWCCVTGSHIQLLILCDRK
jgi:hypothetical protein